MKSIVVALSVALTIAMPTHAEYVTAKSGLRVRAAPSLDAEVVGVLPFATEVSGVAKDGWLETEDGYLSAEYLSDDDPLKDWSYMGSWLTTAYTHTGSVCANGAYPTSGYTVACNSLPIGTELYIKGVGFRTVEDRGPSYMPYEWIDVFMDGYGACVVYGEQYHEVWVIKNP